MSREDLERHLLHLHASFPNARQYLDGVLEPATHVEALHRYKNAIHALFFPGGGIGVGPATVTQVKRKTAEFQKTRPAPRLYVELMVFAAETGASCVTGLGILDVDFISRVENLFGDALKAAGDHGLLGEFEPRFRAMVAADAQHGSGSLGEMLAECMRSGR